ncbi:hypothetical protein DT019_03210 [Streptomyces sp. SDr-06]|uniref:hypothetical protein n=1 Tax=Streptomyces sp. SDr-06 TaxID=2267702 RepID=UPI000DEAA1D9|nr:hypothetical protein [Streptomyces sp. SDr-06]RCH70513.1 hypothetical protein DT019_03210 [Streptomyces sp. SDr-06]
MADVERDDIREMRAQGDLKAFLRQQIAEGRGRRDKPPTVVPPKPPGYRAGAWPTGTSPPGPPPPQPPGAWTTALEAYRAHIVATEHRDRLAEDPGQTCECPPCTDLRRNP